MLFSFVGCFLLSVCLLLCGQIRRHVVGNGLWQKMVIGKDRLLTVSHYSLRIGSLVVMLSAYRDSFITIPLMCMCSIHLNDRRSSICICALQCVGRFVRVVPYYLFVVFFASVIVAAVIVGAKAKSSVLRALLNQDIGPRHRPNACCAG